MLVQVLMRTLSDLPRGRVPCFTACLGEIGNRGFRFLACLEDRDDAAGWVEHAKEDLPVLEKLSLELRGHGLLFGSGPSDQACGGWISAE